ncbi:hypothetical protein TYRP_023472 [Tyrophagus putrescentiae]|nr:hypothetical protein TYRP_023472 [Tyrophagus putrescentiae]
MISGGRETSAEEPPTTPLLQCTQKEEALLTISDQVHLVDHKHGHVLLGYGVDGKTPHTDDRELAEIALGKEAFRVVVREDAVLVDGEAVEKDRPQATWLHRLCAEQLHQGRLEGGLTGVRRPDAPLQHGIDGALAQAEIRGHGTRFEDGKVFEMRENSNLQRTNASPTTLSSRASLYSGHKADLNHGSIRSPLVFLCIKRGRNSHTADVGADLAVPLGSPERAEAIMAKEQSRTAKKCS